MIAICTPTRESVLAGFVYDLVNLTRAYPDSIFTISTGTYLSNLRTLLARTAVDNGVSHVLFIDSDMKFPPDTIKRLLEDDKDIVGANCASRTYQAVTARLGGEYVDSWGPGHKLREVDSIGFGVTMIKAEVFKQLDEPWFAMPWVMDEKKHVGEDIFFCKMAQNAGFHVWVDNELSKEVKHVGLYEYEVK